MKATETSRVVIILAGEDSVVIVGRGLVLVGRFLYIMRLCLAFGMVFFIDTACRQLLIVITCLLFIVILRNVLLIIDLPMILSIAPFLVLEVRHRVRQP